MSRIAVVGEAIIDLHHRPGAGARATHSYTAHPGGSPLNVAVGLGRLGVPTAFLGRFSTDAFGAILRRHALQSGVDLSRAASDTRPSTTAVFDLDDDGAARYAFHLEGAADWHWSREELERIPPEAEAVHFGSLASWREPGCGPVLEAMRELRQRDDVLVGYDPNVRAELFPGAGLGLERVEAAVAASDLVKASVEDLELLYPGVKPQEIAARWLTLGPAAIVVTSGAGGAALYAAARGPEPVVSPAVPVEVVDTVGAGDAFTAALLAELADRDLLSRSGLATLLGGEADAVRDVLDVACAYAAATCTREGADPLWRSEFHALRGRPAEPDADLPRSA